MSNTGESNSDEEDFKKITEASFDKIRRKSAKIGYADGVSDGQKGIFQTAFDTGYADGLRTGFELGKYYAFYENLNATGSQNAALNREKSMYTNMSVPIATDAIHCIFAENAKETNEFSKNQNIYVDNFLKQCQQTLPLTTSLFASQNVD